MTSQKVTIETEINLCVYSLASCVPKVREEGTTSRALERVRLSVRLFSPQEVLPPKELLASAGSRQKKVPESKPRVEISASIQPTSSAKALASVRCPPQKSSRAASGPCPHLCVAKSAKYSSSLKASRPDLVRLAHATDNHHELLADS